METYTTEEQQVEAIKKWWKENGASVIGGIVLGLAAVFGWKAWVGYQAEVGEQASVLFEQLANSVNAGSGEAAAAQAEQLISEYESTPYALFAALAQAKVQLEAGDAAAARERLEWVLAQTDQPGIQQLTRLRLARLQLSEGDAAAAAATLEGIEAGAFGGEFANLEGDIAVASGDLAAARIAYEHALQNDVGNSRLVQMKLDDLAVGSGGQDGR